MSRLAELIDYTNTNCAEDICAEDIPKVDKLESKILAQIEAHPETFDMLDWHSGPASGNDRGDYNKYGTCHCRAGWAIHLAGEAGYALQRRVGCDNAGELIYQKSCGYVPNFFSINERAIKDIRERAAKESAQ